MHLCKFIVTWVAALWSFCPHQVSWTSKIEEYRKWAEDTISQKTEERSWNPSCLMLMGCDSCWVCLATLTRLDSLETASCWPSFKGLILLQRHSLEASSSSTGGIWRVRRLCLEDCHQCLLPDGATGVSDTVGEAFGVPMPYAACNWAMVDFPIRAASDMSPVSSWRGYMKVPWNSGRHIQATAQNVSVKALDSLLSPALASCSIAMMLFL